MKLIIINGPSGVGKSTLTKMLHQEMPKSFLLDMDAMRRYMNGYREFADESRALSYAICHGIVRTCLERGHDVILDRLMLTSEVIDPFRSIANELGAEIHEFILWAPKDVCFGRASERQNAWSKGGLLTPEKCMLFWDKMNVFKDERPEATIVDVDGLSPEEVLKKIQSMIA